MKGIYTTHLITYSALGRSKAIPGCWMSEQVGDTIPEILGLCYVLGSYPLRLFLRSVLFGSTYMSRMVSSHSATYVNMSPPVLEYRFRPMLQFRYACECRWSLAVCGGNATRFCTKFIHCVKITLMPPFTAGYHSSFAQTSHGPCSATCQGWYPIRRFTHPHVDYIYTTSLLFIFTFYCVFLQISSVASCYFAKLFRGAFPPFLFLLLRIVFYHGRK